MLFISRIGKTESSKLVVISRNMLLGEYFCGRLRKRGDFIDQQLIGLRKCATKKLAGFFFVFYS